MELTEIKTLLEESQTLLEENKQTNKTINGIIKDAVAAYGVQKDELKRCKDYYYYKGKGWLNSSNPLMLDKDAKVKDKMTPVFAKLRDFFVDLQDIGHPEWAQEYIDALKEDGINITLTERPPVVSSPDEVEEAVKSLIAYQEIVLENKDTIKEEHAEQSEVLMLSTKAQYPKVAAFYNKISDPKRDQDRTDDSYQSMVADLEQLETAYTVIYDNFKS